MPRKPVPRVECLLRAEQREHAEKIPAHVFAEMAERAGKLFLAHGLHPIHLYFKATMVHRKKAV
jgi:hypothetical protein